MSQQPADVARLEPLVGATGMLYVSETLSSEHPQAAVRKIQGRASLPGPCMPLLGLVDSLGVSRADAHRAVLQSGGWSWLPCVFIFQTLCRLQGCPPSHDADPIPLSAQPRPR